MYSIPLNNQRAPTAAHHMRCSKACGLVGWAQMLPPSQQGGGSCAGSHLWGRWKASPWERRAGSTCGASLSLHRDLSCHQDGSALHMKMVCSSRAGVLGEVPAFSRPTRQSMQEEVLLVLGCWHPAPCSPGLEEKTAGSFPVMG